MTRTTISVFWTVALAASISSAGCREDTRIGVVEASDAAAAPTTFDGASADTTSNVPPTDAATATTLVQGSPGISEMELDATNLYWVANDHDQPTDTSGVWRAARSGGLVTLLVHGPGQMYGLALDEQYVYYVRTGVDMTGGSVWRVSKAGGQPQLLADGLWDPTSIAVDQTHAYFTTGASAGGEIRRLPKGGGPVERVATALDNPWDIAVDQTALYISEMNRSRILRMPKQGGDNQVLASGFGTSWLQVRGNLVFFSSCDIPACPVQTLWRVPTVGGAVEMVHQGSIYRSGKIAVAPGIVLWGSWLLADGAGPVEFALSGEREGPSAVALDGRAAYVAEYFSGRILTLPLVPPAQ